MTSTRVVVSAALVFATALTTQALVRQGAPASPQAPPAAPAADGGRGQAAPASPAQGRGRGRGNPTATLYTETCAGCHGVDRTGGRAPSLFDDEWIHGSDDDTIVKNIENGIPNTEMVAFKGALTEPQIWQLVAYVRSMSGLLRKDVASGRNDDMQVRSQEQAADKAKPVQSAIPPSAEKQ